jgi:hypothetical protein
MNAELPPKSSQAAGTAKGLWRSGNVLIMASNASLPQWHEPAH